MEKFIEMYGLTVVGLFANLIGAIKLYLSIRPSPTNLEGVYEKNGQKTYHNALLDINLAREGIRLIILGVTAQLLAVFF